MYWSINFLKLGVNGGIISKEDLARKALTNIDAGVSPFAWAGGLFALAGLFWGVRVICFWRPLPWPAEAPELPWMQRHRGQWRDSGVRENTLEAFRLAKARGSTMVELDVRLSKDSVAVVNHDETLKRLQGLDLKVCDLTAAELWEKGEVPKLLEVLSDPNCPSLVNIEIKGHDFNDIGLERAVVAAIVEANAQSRVIVSSFNPFSLMRMAKLMPSIPRALLAHDDPGPKNPIYLRKMWFAFLAKPHALNLANSMITQSLMSKLGRRKIPVYVWTVNDQARADQLRNLGVRGLISDIL